MDRHPSFLEWCIWGLIFVLYLWFLTLAGCTSFDPVPDAGHQLAQIYRRDMVVKINGMVYYGTGIIPQANFYNVEVYPKGDVDRIIYQTCNREWVIDQPKEGWSQGKPGFTYLPIPGIEDSLACGLEITAIGQKNSVLGFSYLDFLDKRPEFILPSVVKCNGGIGTFDKGVSICQTAPGLVEEISFPEKAIVKVSRPECDVFKTEDQKTYRFTQPKGICTYTFVGERKVSNGQRIAHRLNLIGYSEVMAK